MEGLKQQKLEKSSSNIPEYCTNEVPDNDSSSDESDSPHFQVISPGNTGSPSHVKVVCDDGHKGIWEMDAKERLAFAMQKKEDGGVSYNAKQFDDALAIYERALDALDSDIAFADDAELTSRRIELQTIIRCNAAQCLLKLNKYSDAERFCNSVLLIDSRNEKALFRRGLARLERNAEGDLVAARQDFEACLCVDAQNQAASSYRDTCEKRLRDQLKQDKRLFGSIFNKLSVELHREEAENRRYELEHATDPFSNVSVWDNKMAEAFIPLEQEMEAFGECAPRVKSVAEIRRDGADDMSDDSEVDEQDEPAATRVNKGSN